MKKEANKNQCQEYVASFAAVGQCDYIAGPPPPQYYGPWLLLLVTLQNLKVKALLLKTLHTLFIKHEEINLVLPWKLQLYWLAFTVVQSIFNCNVYVILSRDNLHFIRRKYYYLESISKTLHFHMKYIMNKSKSLQLTEHLKTL